MCYHKVLIYKLGSSVSGSIKSKQFIKKNDLEQSLFRKTQRNYLFNKIFSRKHLLSGYLNTLLTAIQGLLDAQKDQGFTGSLLRSEERRVGKERRCRRWRKRE